MADTTDIKIWSRQLSRGATTSHTCDARQSGAQRRLTRTNDARLALTRDNLRCGSGRMGPETLRDRTPRHLRRRRSGYDIGSDPNHTVAAAAMDAAGRIRSAVNVDHFTGGPCAELVVMGAAAAAGAGPILTTAAVGDHGRGLISPCRGWRQPLHDFHPGRLGGRAGGTMAGSCGQSANCFPTRTSSRTPTRGGQCGSTTAITTHLPAEPPDGPLPARWDPPHFSKSSTLMAPELWG